MSTITYQIEGKGLISIVYDGSTDLLKIDNNIICLNTLGPFQGISNSFFIHANCDSNYINDLLQKVGFNLYSNFDLSKERYDSLTSFLSFFETGIFYVSKPLVFSFANPDSKCKLVCGGFGSQNCPIFLTKNNNKLNQKLIDKYKTEIKKGERPIILAYRKDYYKGSEVGHSYVIDGHHKLMAYSQLEIPPNLWEIVNIGQTDYDETDQLLCKYLNQKEVKKTSLKYFYDVEEDAFGNIQKLHSR